MKSWTGFERRWRDALFAAMIPSSQTCEGAAIPGLIELDLTAFWEILERQAPPLLRLGLRASVWALTFAPLLVVGSPRLFSSLPEARRDLVLRRAAGSRLYLLRQLVTTIKALACLAYFTDERARELVAASSGAGE
jgi:hypothetical protein